MKTLLIVAAFVLCWGLMISCSNTERRFEPTKSSHAFKPRCKVQNNGCCSGMVLYCTGGSGSRVYRHDDPFRKCGCVSSSDMMRALGGR